MKAIHGASGAADKLDLRPVGQNASQGRWRTEAMRSHATARLLFINKGQGRITVAGLTSGYGPNNLIFLPAGTMYGYELGPTVYGQMLTIPRAMAEEWPEEPVHLRLRDVVAQKEIATLFDSLERELKTDRTGAARAAHYMLGLLAVHFQRQLDAEGAEARPVDPRLRGSAARLVAAYTDLVERDFRKPLGVGHFARTLGVTPTHLSRCCRQTCGRSALSLLSDRRLYEARMLLRDSTLPVQTIAETLGYRSAAYFTRNFHDKTGMTPSRFRKTGQSPAALRARMIRDAG